MSDHKASSLNVIFNHILYKCICVITFEKTEQNFPCFRLLVHTMYFILVAIYVANADGATKANAL